MRRRLTYCLVMLVALTGCKTRYITTEVPVVVHDSIKVAKVELRTDTLWEKSEVRITDTLWLDTSTVATLGMPVLHHDRATEKTTDKGKSSSSSKADTVYIYIEKPVPVTKTNIVEVEKPLTRWEKAKQDVGGMAIGVALVAMLAAIVWGIRKARKLGGKGFN